MKQITCWLLLALSTTAVVFTSCKDDEEEITDTTVTVTGVSLSQPTLSLAVGSEYTLTTTVSPSNATDKTITWTSSNPTVATIANGKITALAAGTVTITAKAGDKTVTCTVTISPNVTGISLDTTALTLTIGEEYTLTATVAPDNATDKSVTWTTSDATKATVSNGKVTAVAVGTTTITATAGTQTATCTIEVLDGVRINGVIWAKSNVDAPGTFAANPEDYGMFYQWNSKVGWPSIGDIGSITATDGSTAWNSSWAGGYATPSSSDTWTSTNDPSPSGWRVPTKAEIETLLNTTNVTREWTTQNSVNGHKFTDKTSGNSIFFPASGNRQGNSGILSSSGSFGFYWGYAACSSNETDILCFNYLGWANYAGYSAGNNFRAMANPVRSVVE